MAIVAFEVAEGLSAWEIGGLYPLPLASRVGIEVGRWGNH